MEDFSVIDPSHTPHNASEKYPTQCIILWQKCAHIMCSFVVVTKGCIVEYETGALWEMCNKSGNPWLFLDNTFTIISQYWTSCRRQGTFVYALSQWDTTLHCNVVSHWLGAYTKWCLHFLLFAILLGLTAQYLRWFPKIQRTPSSHVTWWIHHPNLTWGIGAMHLKHG